MGRRLLNLLTALSLVLLIATGWLYAREVYYGGPELAPFSHYFKSLHARYTLRAAARGICLYGPPYASSARSPATTSHAADLVAQMRNDHLESHLISQDESAVFGKGEKEPFYVHFVEKYDWCDFYRSIDAVPEWQKVPPLLEALEDPDRFVSAHHCLVTDSYNSFPEEPGDIREIAVSRRADGSLCYGYYGLRVELSQLKEKGAGVNPGGLITTYSSRQHIDPAQFPPLRARWHRALDEPLARVRYPAALAGAAVVPGLWCIASGWRLARWRRLRLRNRCMNCGYDLRATPGRCPECGAASEPQLSNAAPDGVRARGSA